MSTRRTLLGVLLAAAAASLGCRARLPVGPEAPAVSPSGIASADRKAGPARADFRAAAALARSEEAPRVLGLRPYQPALTPDRLREVVRYNPPSTGWTSVGDYLFRVRICAPGEH